jgi:hypothetical protein
MAAGTSVTDKNPRGLVVLGGYFTLNPGSIAAAGREEQTVAVPAAKVGDLVVVAPRDVLLAGLVIGHARVSAAGTISFWISNHSAGAVDQASGVWDYTLIRGGQGISHAG